MKYLELPILSILILCVSCGGPAEEETPTGAVKAFFRAVARSENDVEATKEVVRLLSPQAQQQLRKRAELASTLTGREFAPQDMIPKGRLFLRYQPRMHKPFVEHISGNHALVTIYGEKKAETSTLRLLKSGNAWRIDLPLPPLESRASTEPARSLR